MACVVQTFFEEGIPYRFEGSTVKIHGNLMGEGNLWRIDQFVGRIEFVIADAGIIGDEMTEDEKGAALVAGAVNWVRRHLTPR